MKTLPIALQVYSVREDAEKNLKQTLQEVKNMGYDGVELAGLYGHTPEEVRDYLKEIGLTPISAHVPYEAFMNDLQGTIQCYVTIGCRYVAIPYLMPDSRYGTEKFELLMKNIPIISAACKKAGLVLLYHNHDFEFVKTPEGEYLLDYMYRTFPADELKVELDTCWVKVAGVDPSQYLLKYSGRCPVLHLKDYNGEKPPVFRAVGHGVQNMPALLEAANSAGCEWVVVEQDSHTQHTALEDALLSIQCLKTLGL